MTSAVPGAQVSRRLAVLAIDASREAGGAERALVAAAGHLVAAGAASWRLLAPGGGAVERLATAAGIRFAPAPLDRLGLVRPLATGLALDVVLDEVAREPPDVVLVNGQRSLKACLALGRSGPPVVAYVHDVLEPGTVSPTMRAFRLFSARVARYLAPAEASRASLERLGIASHRTRVVAPATCGAAPLDEATRAHVRRTLGVVSDAGTHGGRARLGGGRDGAAYAGDEVLVGFVGQVEARKGVDVWLDLVERVDRALAADRGARPGRSIAWVLAGDDPFGEHVRFRDAAFARARRLTSVRLTGWRTDAARVVAALDVLVCPSRQDACPLVVLDALAAGVPVVACAVGGIPEQLGDGAGVLVAPGDGRALAEAVTALAADPDLRRAIAERGRRRFAERFSVAAASAALLAELEDAARASDR